MRVISLVPSWTETLLACGVDVVGRTRYCVHPRGRVEAIPVVGGTKDLDLEKVKALAPDVLLLDKEENLPWMAAGQPWRTQCTHVESCEDLPRELDELAALFGNRILAELAQEWRECLSQKQPEAFPSEPPALLEWIRRPEAEPEHVLYLIWKDPLMAASKDTFIGSLLERLGYRGKLPYFAEKYPVIDLARFNPARTLLLYSTEPFPFARHREELASLPFASALVDGESLSWFGLRSLRFLQGKRPNSS